MFDQIELSFGINCKNNEESLTAMDMESLYGFIRESTSEVREQTKTLRTVLKYSAERYRVMKTKLPFFSCSIFDPPYRGLKNFKEALGLVIDIDMHADIDEELISRLKTDPRIILGYVSPSHQGVKLIFLFDKPISDPVMYTQVYKDFTLSFSTDYQLTDKVDMKNCDASRISFLCYDANAWYNPDFINITWDPTKYEIETNTSLSPNKENITDAQYKTILTKLQTRALKTKNVEPIHPSLTEILEEIRAGLQIYEISIASTEGIQYGMKMKLQKNKDEAEINIYHGKQGYKVVTAPRRGTHPSLNEICKHVIEAILQQI
ncbi:MAG: CRISPR-associated primase-polymerase type B [Saprospiraceae bacterium]